MSSPDLGLGDRVRKEGPKTIIRPLFSKARVMLYIGYFLTLDVLENILAYFILICVYICMYMYDPFTFFY